MSRKFLIKFINRNPRNMEMMGLQAKPLGYDLEVDRERRSFIYKFRARLLRHSSYIEAQLLHYKNGVVLGASSKERDIASQLYSKTDTSAALNLGRVLALRCLMSGIHHAIADDAEDDIERSQHLKAFYKALAYGGITLKEIPHIEHSYLNDRTFTFDRYDVHHDKRDKTDEP